MMQPSQTSKKHKTELCNTKWVERGKRGNTGKKEREVGRKWSEERKIDKN